MYLIKIENLIHKIEVKMRNKLKGWENVYENIKVDISKTFKTCPFSSNLVSVFRQLAGSSSDLKSFIWNSNEFSV